jgi:putative ABC transport system permease protein
MFTSLPADDKQLPKRFVAGQMYASDDEQVLLVNELLAYLWGAGSDDALNQLIGKTVRLEFRQRDEAVAHTLAFRSGRELNLSGEEVRALSRGLDRIPSLIAAMPLPDEEKAVLLQIFPEKTATTEPTAPQLVTAEYAIVGVFRGTTEDEERDGNDLGWAERSPLLVLPTETATDLYYRLVRDNDYALSSATVIVDSENHLKIVAERLRELGYQEYSLIRLVEHIQYYVNLSTWVFAAVAAIAMFVAAVGITNTMIMSVVERTHEIGVMKTVGARDRHVLSIFLVEGALVGLLGAAAAIAISFGLSFAIDYAIRLILEVEIHRSFEDETVLVFSWWMFAAVLVFASAVTMLAAVIPARRAARISPVAALRHE